MMQRKFKSPEDMLATFEEYREKCASHTVKRTAFSQSLGRHVTDEIPSPITCSINGFCVFAPIDKKNWDGTYKSDPAYEDVIAYIYQYCEADAREKFEDGTIPPQLAPLWMGAYGFSTKQVQDIKGGVPVVIKDDLGD